MSSSQAISWVCGSQLFSDALYPAHCTKYSTTAKKFSQLSWLHAWFEKKQLVGFLIFFSVFVSFSLSLGFSSLVHLKLYYRFWTTVRRRSSRLYERKISMWVRTPQNDNYCTRTPLQQYLSFRWFSSCVFSTPYPRRKFRTFWYHLRETTTDN